MFRRLRNLQRKLLLSLAVSLWLPGATAVGGEVADVGIILRGYEGTTLFPTNDTFETRAQIIIENLNLLSFGEVSTYAIYNAGIDPDGARTAQKLKNIEACQAALAGWPEPEWSWMANNFPQLTDPTDSQRALVQELIDWMITNNLPASEWASTETGSATNPDSPWGNSNYFWLQSNVLRFSGSGSFSMLSDLRLPANYDPEDHDITLIVFSHTGDFNVAGAQLSLEGFGVLGADGSAVSGPAAYADYSAVSPDVANMVSVHEAVHAYGMGTHDKDPDTVHPDYSVMRQQGRIDTLPAYNRLYWLGWLPSSTITQDPSQISDLSGAINANARYLLDIGTGEDGLQRYQELFEDEWIQYRVDANTLYYEVASENIYSIGGVASGLAGSQSVVLQNNAGDNLTISANGSFSFPSQIGYGNNYNVTVLTSPTGKSCSVSDGSGAATADITNVTIACTISAHTIGGSVSGLAGSQSVVLQNNAGDNLTISANGSFSFPSQIGYGNNYNVTVLTSPTGKSCSVSDGSGAATADITNVEVICTSSPLDQEPAKPDITTVEGEDGEIMLRVSVSYTGDSAIIRYTATCISGDHSVTSNSISSPIVVTGLDSTKTYTCSVTATNTSGHISSPSQDTSSIVPADRAVGLPIWLLYQAIQ